MTITEFLEARIAEDEHIMTNPLYPDVDMDLARRKQRDG